MTPYNAVTKKPYSGTNITLLSVAAEELGAKNDPRWMTFMQAQALGLKVKKGSHGTKIYFWKPLAVKDPDDADEAVKSRLVRKTYIVFHATQIEGMESYVAE